ncbi:hypothetical protein Hanom_Chr10g00949261 [Helianthus anomalus]
MVYWQRFTWRDDVSWLLVMKEYGETESWSVHFKVNTVPQDVTVVFQPLNDGDILACYDGSIVQSFQTRLFTELMEFGHCCSDFEMEPYVETLELVNKESVTACRETIFCWRIKEYHHLGSYLSKRW